MKKITLITLLLILTFALNAYVIVRQDGLGDFTNLSDAIDSITGTETILLVGSATPYTGNNNRDLTWNGNTKHIYIKGMNNPIIDCEEASRFLAVYNGNANDKLEGLEIINGHHDYGAGAIYAENGTLEITNCGFTNCITHDGMSPGSGGAIRFYNMNDVHISNSRFVQNEALSGSAIYMEDCLNAYINNNFFDSNLATYYIMGGWYWYGEQGAIALINSDNTTIISNLFDSNKSRAIAACLYTDINTDGVEIIDNQFINNEVTHGSLQDPGILFLYNTAVIRNNIFMNDSEPYSYCSGRPICSVSNLEIISCTFISNWHESEFNCEQYTNCIFQNTGEYTGNIDSDLSYCIIEGFNFSAETTLTNCIIEEDPLLDSNYQPIWNTTQKSPCIDAGNPDSDGDGEKWYDDDDECDADGSRRDIGAIPAIPHNNDAWKLPYYMIDGNLKWISFPSVDITVGNYTMYNMMQELINPDEDALEKVDWIEVGTATELSFEWITGNPGAWTNSDYLVISSQGFKMQMQDDCYEEYVLEVSGQLANPNTEIPLLGEGQENWIGYFLETSMDAKEAFAGVWDNLYKIKTQYWSMLRIEGTNIWLHGPDSVLEYGDMVVVQAYEDCTLIWNDGEPQNPKDKRTSENFDFTEEPDYVPIYVAVDPEDDVEEIGVFVDGECKGAAVVQSEMVDINAYIIGDTGEVEFVKYYGDRSPIETLSEYLIFNPQTGQNELGKIELSQNSNYYYVSFREDDANEIPPTFKTSNFPNPFNPSTTINYSIPNDTNVELSIFNVKGQKVTTLVNEAQAAGIHNAVWKGTDNQGNKVSSGIYFYKIVTGENSEMKKMLLLK